MSNGFMTLTGVPSKQIQSSNLNFTHVLHHLATIFLQFNLPENIWNTRYIHETNNHFKLKGQKSRVSTNTSHLKIKKEASYLHKGDLTFFESRLEA